MCIRDSFNDLIVPQANLAGTNTLEAALGRALTTEVGNNVLYSRFGHIKEVDGQTDRQLTHLFYSRRFRGGEMKDVTVIDFSRMSQRQMLKAESGRWNQARGMWEFSNGTIVNLDEATGSTTSAQFQRYDYPLSRTPIDLARIPTDPGAMTVGQALRAERLYREAGNAREVRRMRVRIQEKFAFPAICLVFGLIGSSLGVRPHNRTSRSQGFGISVLLIFGYYLMSFIFSSLGIAATLPPFLAAWGPVLIGLSGGLYLLRQASR